MNESVYETTPKDHGLVYGANLAWTPSLALFGNWLAIRGDFAVNYLLPGSGISNGWWILESGAIVSFCLFDHLLVEGGPEFQEWIWNSSASPTSPPGGGNTSPSISTCPVLAYTASLGWYFPEGISFLRKINRVFY